MNSIDLIFAAILAVSCSVGFVRGIGRELSSIIALAAGFALANAWHQGLAETATAYFDSPGQASFAAYLAILLATMLAGWLVLRVATAIIRPKPPGLGAGHALGGMLGFSKGALFCAILFIALTAFALQGPRLKTSTLAPHVAKIAALVERFLPADLAEAYRQGLEQNRRSLDLTEPPTI